MGGGEKRRGKDREGEGEPKGPHQYNLTRGEETKISIVEKLKQQSVRSQFDCNFWKKISLFMYWGKYELCMYKLEK